MDGRYSGIAVIGTGLGDASQLLANAKAFGVGPRGLVSVHVVTDGGNARNAPTDSPNGVLHMYASSDTKDPLGSSPDAMGYDIITKADADLAAVSPSGTNVVSGGWASFELTPGMYVKFVYSYVSGGGSGSRMRVAVVSS